jgi:hypothetical protein
MEKITILKTNRSEYSIKEAANNSITVRELIEYLQDNLDLDSRIVFSNDNGYTYGYITETVVGEETWEEEPEEDDDEWTREEMVSDIERAIEKNGGKPITVKVVWLKNYDDKEVLTAGYDDSGRLGITLEDGSFVLIDELNDDEVDSVWFEATQLRR